MFDIATNQYKLSNQRAKLFLMDNVLSKLTQDQFNIAATELKPDCRSLSTLSVLAFTQRFLSWTEINTQITGPAVNFKVRNAHLNPYNEWHKTIDCDFLLSFHNPSWPPSATEWKTRVPKCQTAVFHFGMAASTSQPVTVAPAQSIALVLTT
jgi:hypothetical protein